MTNQSDETKLAVLTQKVDDLKDDVSEVKKLLTSGYVTKEQHLNVVRRIRLLEKLVYGAVALIVIAVFGAMISLVINSGSK